MPARLTLAIALVFAAPAAGQPLPAAEAEQVRLAETSGQMLFAYDQAAWHATDAMLAEAESRGLADKLPELLDGWVVSGDTDAQTVTFYDRNTDAPQAVFVVRTADGGRRVISTSHVAGTPAATLDAATRALIRARAAAVAALRGQDVLRCSSTFNVVVLPPERPGGETMVYFLAARDQADSVPFGGHYRFAVSPAGVAGPMHGFTHACLDTPVSRNGEKVRYIVVTQLIDQVPSEVAVFNMLSTGLPLYVMMDGPIPAWAIEAPDGQARIRVVRETPK